MRLVDIIFFQLQRGEYNGSDSSLWTDLGVNFLGAAFGAALGFIAAWWLFQQQLKVEKQKDAQATEQLQNERLKFFKFLVENVRTAIGKQVTDLGKTAAAIRIAPLNIHPLLIRYAIGENWELIKFNSANFFSAYQYYNNQQEDYRKLIDLLSFYFALYQDLKRRTDATLTMCTSGRYA
jgi:hypothetical protein